MNESNVMSAGAGVAVPVERPRSLENVRWGALAAGFLVGTGLLVLLLSLGAAIGFTSVDPRDLASWKHMGVGVGIWGVIAAVVSSFVAAWLTARLSSATERRGAMLHGVTLWGLTWAVALGIGAVAMSGAVDTASRTVPAAVAATKEVTRGDADANRRGPEVVAAGQDGGALNRASNTTPSEAGEAAANGGKTAAWGAFLVTLLTLIASAVGGAFAVPDRSRVEVARVPDRSSAGKLSPGHA